MQRAEGGGEWRWETGAGEWRGRGEGGEGGWTQCPAKRCCQRGEAEGKGGRGGGERGGEGQKGRQRVWLQVLDVCLGVLFRCESLWESLCVLQIDFVGEHFTTRVVGSVPIGQKET